MKLGTPGFNGARLRQGREARGMSASALADIVGVSRAAISQYESAAKASPSPDVFRKLCAALNLGALWFTRPDTAPRGSSTIYFRCMSAATKGARLRAERRYDWLREIVKFLMARVVFPAVNFPDLDFPSDPTQISDSDVDAAATYTRRFWGMNDGPISNVTWLLENKGAVVSRFELYAATLDALSDWEINDNRPYVVLSADKGSACRSRFDAAHELAHLILHRRVPKSHYTPNEAFRLMEDHANRFAAAFLLPEETFTKECASPTLDGLLAMKPRWRVSVAAMIMRLGQLSLVSPDQEQRLWMNRSRRKWRTVEPLDDIIQPEQPQFLRQCFEVLVSKGVMSGIEVPFHLGLPARDIEQIAGLRPGYLDTDEVDIALTDDAVQEAEERSQIIRFTQLK